MTEEKPRVTFDPGVEKHRSEKQKDISRRRARGRLTAGGNDGGSSTDGVGSPPRGNCSSQIPVSSDSASLAPQGSYRKPLELLLDQLDKHWAGERPLHHTYFLCELALEKDVIRDRASHLLTPLQLSVSTSCP